MSLLDTLLLPIRRVFYAGSLLPAEPALAFVGAGVTVSDSPSTAQTIVSISGSGFTPSTPILLTSSTLIVSPQVSQSYVVQSSSPITVTVAGTPVSGVKLTFYDQSKNWTTYNFTFVAQSGWTVRIPWNIAGTDTNSVTFGAGVDAISGQSFTLEAVNQVSQWLA
jgi:hypothetical protein